jgi:hypothetical protein
MLLAHGTTYHELRDYLLSSSAWQVVVKAGADDKSEDLLQREQSQSSTTRVVMKVPFNEYGRSKLIAGTSKARLQPGRKKDLVVGAGQPLTPILVSKEPHARY